MESLCNRSSHAWLASRVWDLLPGSTPARPRYNTQSSESTRWAVRASHASHHTAQTYMKTRKMATSLVNLSSAVVGVGYKHLMRNVVGVAARGDFLVCNRQCKSTPSSACSSRTQNMGTGIQHVPPACYGGRHTVTMIPGDGIGPELMLHLKEVFRHARAPVDFEEHHLSGETTSKVAEEVDAAIIAVKRNGVALKGNIHTDLKNLTHVQEKSANVKLRVGLDLFANVIRCKTIPGVRTRHDNIDIIIIRENTEGEYSSLEHENVSGVVESLKIITAEKSRRIAEYAFEYAIKHGRRKVTAIHKANIMKLGDGLFLQSCRDVAAKYPDIEFNDLIVDNCCMQLVSRPEQFDVMVMPNLYGNIISNIGCGLVGGPGLVAGQNVGEDFAVFETATRNTGKTIAGHNVANPTATLLAGALLLDHLNLSTHAKAIRRATIKTLTEEKIHTPDLGGQASTSDFVQHVIGQVEKMNH